MPNKRTIPRICGTCRKPFLAALGEVKRGWALYCTTSCRPPRPRLGSRAEILENGEARIPLYARDGTIRTYTLIDAVDAEWACRWRWKLTKGYAMRNRGSRTICLHREVLGLTEQDERVGDHISRDRLDNRRSNLRAIPKHGNAHNASIQGGSSSYRGVSWGKQIGKWVAYAGLRGEKHYLGCFIDELEAAEAARLGRARLQEYAVD